MKKGDVLYFPSAKLDKFYGSEKIRIGRDKYSVLLLKELLNDEYFDRIKKCIKNETSCIKINTFIDDSELVYEKIMPSTFIRALESLIMNEELTDKEFDRILSLREIANFDRFIEKYKNKSITMIIDGFQYKIRFIDIIKFISLSKEEYELLLNSRFKTVKGVPKTSFMYATKVVMNENDFTSKYTFPNYVVERLKSIENNEDIDIEAINRITSCEDQKLNKVLINPILEHEVLKDLPTEYNQLEKAIYIYLKLCTIFTYDPLFFAFDQKGEAGLIHRDINRIPTITPKNNRVVCYEMNAIFGYFLNKLGIKYIPTDPTLDDYGVAHSKLEFRYDKFLVRADSLRTIIDCDFVSSKIGDELTGLTLENTNPETNEEFYLIVNKVYDRFKRDNHIEEQLKHETLPKDLSLEDKLELIVRMANNKGLDPVDNIGYIYKLKRLVYNAYELCDVSSTIIKYYDGKQTTLRLVFTTSDDDGNYVYYIYEPNKELKQIEKEELRDLFEDGTASYLEKHVDEIPQLDISRSMLRKVFPRR